MNEIVHKFLSAEYKLMPEMHLGQTGFTYSACGPFTKKKKKKKKRIEWKILNKQEIHFLDKACFQHDIAYGHLKDLTWRTASDKILPDKAFNIAKNLKYDGY